MGHGLHSTGRSGGVGAGAGLQVGQGVWGTGAGLQVGQGVWGQGLVYR